MLNIGLIWDLLLAMLIDFKRKILKKLRTC